MNFKVHARKQKTGKRQRTERGKQKKKKEKKLFGTRARVTRVKRTTDDRETYISLTAMFAQASSYTRKVWSLIQLSLILAKGANARPLGD